MVSRKLVGQKTYWHLLGAGRMPTQYELVTSRLLYYPGRGFEVATPVADWYRRHQQQSPLRCDDWEAFSDPRATTYASYIHSRRDEEVYLSRLLDGATASELAAGWTEVAAHVLAVLRFPCHGLMMAAAYVAQLAPSGRIVVAGALQAGDELRRVHRLAYRLAQLRRAQPGLGDDARGRWETAAPWQPWRELVERTLVTYDWGECFAALCLAIKPAWDRLLCHDLAAALTAAGDRASAELLASFAGDARWHREWSAALARMAIAQRDDNRQVLRDWVDAWAVRVDAASRALLEAFTPSPDEGVAAIRDLRAQHLAACGLSGEVP